MQQKRHSVDQVIFKLRKADVEPGKGKKVSEVCKEHEAAEQTYPLLATVVWWDAARGGKGAKISSEREHATEKSCGGSGLG